MEQNHICASICDHLPTLSESHPWLVDHNLQEANKHHIVYSIRDPPSQHTFRIPSCLGTRRIRGCFYGWVILSNHPHNDMWSLWNPTTSNIIRLPRFIPKNGDRGSTGLRRQCCLSSPPNAHGSIFMLTVKEYSIAFCRLDCKRKKLKWVEMSYAKQMRNVAGCDGFLHSLTCCNGKVYALNSARRNALVIHIDIVVKGTEVVISLLPYLKQPSYYVDGCLPSVSFLQGCCAELFYIELSYVKEGHAEKKTVGGVQVFKLDMTSDIRWEKVEDLKDAAFFLDLAHGDYSAFYSPAIGSALGGYVHFLDRSGLVINSYDVKNKTIGLSSMPTSDASMLECRLQGDHGEIKSRQEEDGENVLGLRDEENMESCLVDIPFDVLKTIMELCVGVEYLNFRATCKKCQLAAPMIRWSKERRLQMYSLASPWLMVFESITTNT